MHMSILYHQVSDPVYRGYEETVIDAKRNYVVRHIVHGMFMTAAWLACPQWELEDQICAAPLGTYL